MAEFTTHHGGAILLELRRRAGLSQARLAKASGVSVRTIRAIENGQHRAPHEATLRALARGIGLNEADTARLAKAWDHTRSLLTFEELIANGSDVASALAELNLRSRNTHRLVSSVHHFKVAATRRVACVDVVTVIEALQDGVDTHLVFQGGDHSIDARLLRMDRVEGFRLAGQHVVPERNAVMFELALGAPLAAGDTKVVRYRIDLGGHPPEDPELAAIWHRLGDSDGMAESFSRVCTAHTIQVTFEDCAPTGVWRVTGAPEPQPAGALELDEWNSVHVVGQNLEAGTYGIAWSWD